MPLVSTRQRDDDREEVLFLRRAPGIDSGTPLFLYFYFLPFFSLFSCPPSSVLHPLIHYLLTRTYLVCERRKMQRCPDKIFVKRSPDYFLVCSIYPYERVRYLLFISLLKKYSSLRMKYYYYKTLCYLFYKARKNLVLLCHRF